MTELDALILSVGLNLCFLAHNYVLRKRFEALSNVFGKLLHVIKSVADSEVVVYRDREQNIRVKEKTRETDRHSVSTDQNIQADTKNPA